MLHTITANIVGKVKSVKMAGRDYLAAPAVFMVEGVHNGSKGRVYYTSEQLTASVGFWGMKPAVVYHPKDGDQFISACQADVIEKHGVGVLMDVKTDTKGVKGSVKGLTRLVGNVYFEESRLEVVDPRVLAALQAQTPMEVSIGVYTDEEDVEGEWNGTTYRAKAVNLRPDHLAILPDQVGACSLADGAGLLVCAANENPSSSWAVNVAAAAVRRLLANAKSFNQIIDDLAKLLRDRFPSSDDKPYPSVWVEDVFDGYVVFSRDGKLYRLNYTSSATGTVLNDGTPVEVSRVVEYRAVDTLAASERTMTMTKTELVDAIVANKDSGWEVTDRDHLLKFEDTKLQRIHLGLKSPAVSAAPAATVGVLASAATPAAPAAGAQGVPMTLQAYIAAAPLELRGALTALHQKDQARRAELVGGITANKANRFTPEWLSQQSTEVLEGLGAVAIAPAPQTYGVPVLFTGAQGAPTTNTAASVPVLLLPGDTGAA